MSVEDDTGLTRRQREVLDLIARGMTNAEIAETLGISLAGAKWQVSEAIGKLGVASRGEAAELWLARHSPGQRLRRFARALAVPLAFGAAGAGVAGAAILAFGALLADDPPPDDGPTPAPQLEHLALAATPRANHDAAVLVAIDAAIGVAQGSGLRLTANQLSIVRAELAPASTEVASNVSGVHVPVDPPGDTWTVHLRTTTPTPLANDILVVVRDRTWEVVVAGFMGGPVGPDDPPVRGPELPMASATFEGVTITLAAQWRRPVVMGSAGAEPGWCTLLRDSRYRGFGGGGCGLAFDPLRGQAIALGSYGEQEGIATTTGFIADGVASVRLSDRQGDTTSAAIAEPPAGSGFPVRMYLALTDRERWFVRAEAFDAAGNLLGAIDLPALD